MITLFTLNVGGLIGLIILAALILFLVVNLVIGELQTVWRRVQRFFRGAKTPDDRGAT